MSKKRDPFWELRNSSRSSNHHKEGVFIFYREILGWIRGRLDVGFGSILGQVLDLDGAVLGRLAT